jgi:predicted transcriptional regulator of viral defense system
MTVEARSLPRVLAAIAAELEMNEATFVTLDDIRRIAEDHGFSSSARDIAWRLRRHGWLLPTESSGVWEFAPASHAGPYGRGDVFAELDGALSRNPNQDLRIALVSALWIHGWSERPPSKHEIAAAPEAKVTSGLRRTYRIVRFDSRLPAARRRRRTPVEAPATILAHLAVHPAHVSSWEAIEFALPELADNTTADQLREEMTGRPAAVSARLGYLLHNLAPKLVRNAGLKPAPTLTRFGSEPASRRFNSYWNVADTILPFDPAEIGIAS